MAAGQERKEDSMLKIEFTSEDIIEGKNFTDLLEHGEFVARFVILEVDDPDETISSFTAQGVWMRPDGTSVLGVLRVSELEWNITPPPTYQEAEDGTITAGEIFSGAGWIAWTVETA